MYNFFNFIKIFITNFSLEFGKEAATDEALLVKAKQKTGRTLIVSRGNSEIEFGSRGLRVIAVRAVALHRTILDAIDADCEQIECEYVAMCTKTCRLS